jgi:hypothetical protein
MTRDDIDGLVESWHNGNRSTVVDDLLAEADPAAVALATGRLLACLLPDEQDTLLRLLSLRVTS